jgi:hypothetical protein
MRQATFEASSSPSSDGKLAQAKSRRSRSDKENEDDIAAFELNGKLLPAGRLSSRMKSRNEVSRK